MTEYFFANHPSITVPRVRRTALRENSGVLLYSSKLCGDVPASVLGRGMVRRGSPTRVLSRFSLLYIRDNSSGCSKVLLRVLSVWGVAPVEEACALLCVAPLLMTVGFTSYRGERANDVRAGRTGSSSFIASSTRDRGSVGDRARARRRGRFRRLVGDIVGSSTTTFTRVASCPVVHACPVG